MCNSGIREPLLKARMHSLHMLKVRPMEFSANIENDAAILNETRPPQEDCVSVDHQHVARQSDTTSGKCNLISC